MTQDRSSTRRYLALFLPLLSADRWLREGGDAAAPTAFVEKQRGAMRVVAANEVALALGIGPGIALADARARVPDLLVLPYEPQADAALLDSIADDCERYTPSVALDPPDGLILDITGCTHHWDGEGELVSDLAARLAHAGFTLRLALAETPDKARALARHGGELLNIRRGTPPERLNEARVAYLAPPLQEFRVGLPRLNPVPGATNLKSAPSSPSPLGGEGRGEGVHSPDISNPLTLPSPQRGEESFGAGRSGFPGPRPEGEGLLLPIAALDPDPDQATALRRAGLYSIGDLACRPRGPLAARFGMGLVAKLARVLGDEDVRIVPRRALPAVSVLRRFAEPVARNDYILEVIAQLVAEAGVILGERGEGGRRFAIRLFRSDGDVRRLAIATGTPTRDPALLVRLLRERIDSLADPLDPGFGYDAIRLDVPLTEPLRPEQSGLERAQGGDLAGLLDRLSVRLGGRRVQRFASGNSHIPELAGLTGPAQTPMLPVPWPQPEPGEPPIRPFLLFDPPQPVEVIAEVPDGPPRKFRWRRTLHDIVAHEGPERIASEWWKRKGGYQPGKGGLTRDYYRVEDSEGRRFWLFRHGLYGAEAAQPGWYLHGRFA